MPGYVEHTFGCNHPVSDQLRHTEFSSFSATGPARILPFGATMQLFPLLDPLSSFIIKLLEFKPVREIINSPAAYMRQLQTCRLLWQYVGSVAVHVRLSSHVGGHINLHPPKHTSHFAPRACNFPSRSSRQVCQPMYHMPPAYCHFPVTRQNVPPQSGSVCGAYPEYFLHHQYRVKSYTGWRCWPPDCVH